MRITAIVFCTFLAFPSWADSISYQLTGFGSRQVLVSLAGAQKSTVTASMSSDGLSLRISGVSVSFLAGKSQVTPALVSSVQSVQRGAYTDLVINLSSPAELTISPGTSDLKLFLTFKSGIKPTIAAVARPTESTPAQTTRKSSLPLRILTSDANPPEPHKVEPGVTILLPQAISEIPESDVSAELRHIAYALDLLWVWASGQSLPTTTSEAAGAAPTGDTKKLERLIDDLSHELISLHKELADRDSEIRRLKSQP